METAKLLSKSEAEGRIREWAKLLADGGPNKLKEALGVARAWGIKEEIVEELFDDAERLAAGAGEIFENLEEDYAPQPETKVRQEKPKIEIVKTEPDVKTEPVARVGPELKLISGRWYSVRGNDVRRWWGPEPQIAAEPQIGLKPQEQTKPEPEEEQEKAKGEDQQLEWNGVLDREAPLDNARKLVGLRYWHQPMLGTKLRFWQKEFWEWNGKNWKVVDDGTMRAKIYQFLDLSSTVRFTKRLIENGD
jgi:hypothetical protein